MSSTTKKAASSLPLTREVLASLRPAKKLSNHEGASITSLDFDDSGQYLISSGVDKSIQLYDCYKGVRHKDIQSQKYGAHLARFSHNDLGCLYASTPAQDAENADHSIRHLSLSTKSYLRYFKGHKDQVVSLEVNPVSETFLSASADHTVKTWDLRTSTPMGSIGTGQASVVAYDPHGIVFAVAKAPLAPSTNGVVSLYSVSSFEKGPFVTRTVPGTPDEPWTKIEFSNNGKYLLVVTGTPRHYVLDALSGKLLAILVLDPTPSMHWLHFQYIGSGSACFSPDGKFVLAGHSNGNVALFDLAHLKTESRSPLEIRPAHMLPNNHGLPKVLAFDPKLLLLATADDDVVLWSSNYDDF